MSLYSHSKLGKPECPYVERWMLDFKLFTLRIHHWLASDDLRHPHDHPWWFLTICLKGGYTDVGDVALGWHDPVGRRITVEDHLGRGSIRFRSAHHRHSVKVDKGGAWTILLTGREKRVWGFWVKGKFRKRNKYFFEHGHHPCDS